MIMATTGAPADFKDIQDIIEQLPKQRQKEIGHRVELFEAQLSRELKVESRQSVKNEPPISARSKLRGGVSARSGGKQEQLKHRESTEGHENAQHQAVLNDVLMTIKNIKQDRDRLRPNQVYQNLMESLAEMGIEGAHECKGPILQQLYGLLSIYPQKPSFMDLQRQEAIRSLLLFLLKLFQVDTSVKATFNQELETCESVELQQAISCTLIMVAILPQADQTRELLHLLFKSATRGGVPVVQFVQILKQAMMKFNPSPLAVPSGLVLIVSNVVYFVADSI